MRWPDPVKIISRLCRLELHWDMKCRSEPCPYCGRGKTKRNGKRGGHQQYRCRACARQWVESRDPLVSFLRARGIDARRQGILRAVGLFIRGLSMARVEKITKIKGETLKGYLEMLREQYRQGLGNYVDELLVRKARLSSSDISGLRSFWSECEMTRHPYRTRGQDPSIK